MKILTVNNWQPIDATGGAELLCHDIFNGLTARGHKITVLSAGPERYVKGYEVIPALSAMPHVNDPKKLETPLSKIRWIYTSLVNYHRAKLFIQRIRPEVAYFHNLEWITLSPLSAALNLGIKTVCHAHNHIYSDYWINRRQGVRTITKLVHADPDLKRCRMIAISHSIAKPLIDNGFPKENVVVIYNGLPEEIFQDKSDKPRERKAIFVGAISPHKGVHIAIGAIGLLKKKGIELPLDIIGRSNNPDYLEQLRTIIRENGLENLVRFLGPHPRQEVWDRMRRAEMVLVPSLCEEAFCLVAAEAMACGALPVVSDRGALPEVVANAGIVVKPSIESWAEAISRLLDMMECDRTYLIQTAVKTARDKFRLSRVVEKVEAVLLGKNHA